MIRETVVKDGITKARMTWTPTRVSVKMPRSLQPDAVELVSAFVLAITEGVAINPPPQALRGTIEIAGRELSVTLKPNSGKKAITFYTEDGYVRAKKP